MAGKVKRTRLKPQDTLAWKGLTAEEMASKEKSQEREDEVEF